MSNSEFQLYMLSDNSWCITKTLNPTTKIVHIPENIDGHPVSMIGEDVFMDNRFIEEVYLPGTIITIGAYAFAGCTNLKIVQRIYTDNPITINENAFEDCVHLQKVYLNNIFSIQPMAFYNCKELTYFPFIECSQVQTFGNMSFALSGIKTIILFNHQKVFQRIFHRCDITEVFLQNELHCDNCFYELLKKAKVLVVPNSPLLDLIYFGIDVEELYEVLSLYEQV